MKEENLQFSLKYRPRTFNEMVGQGGIILEMKNRSLNLNFPQSMVFEGMSGSGKSTLAFIIATLINCKNPVKKEDCLSPCRKCNTCRDIIEERYNRDIYYLDASKMKKEDIISIREDIVGMAPLYDNKKIVIIDEAQELSKAGKGATLSLLEKKRNVHYILCTMNPESLDEAIKSRCQVFHFNPLRGDKDIMRYLQKIIEKENLDLPEEFYKEGLGVIADNSSGNLRNAIQLLERCIFGEFYTLEKIEKSLNIISSNNVMKILDKLLSRDPVFFDLTRDLDLKHFFFYSWKVLNNIRTYSVTKKLKGQDKRIKYLADTYKEDVSVLLNHYINTLSTSFFSSSVFTTEILKFFSKTNDNGGFGSSTRKTRKTKS